jgi:hypothetical protein
MSTSPKDEAALEKSSPEQMTTFDAKERIEDFNWQGLEETFHKEMEKCNKEEKKLYEELGSLMNVRLSAIFQTSLIIVCSTLTFGPNLCTLMSQTEPRRGRSPIRWEATGSLILLQAQNSHM